MKSPTYAQINQKGDGKSSKASQIQEFLMRNSSKKELQMINEGSSQLNKQEDNQQIIQSSSIKNIQFISQFRSDSTFSSKICSAISQMTNANQQAQRSPPKKLTSFKDMRNERKISKSKQRQLNDEESGERLRIQSRENSNEQQLSSQQQRSRQKKYIFKDLNQLRNQKKIQKQQHCDQFSDNGCQQDGKGISENQSYQRHQSPSDYDRSTQEQYSLYGKDNCLNDSNFHRTSQNFKAPSILFQTGLRQNQSPDYSQHMFPKRESLHHKTNTCNQMLIQSQLQKSNLYKSCSKQDLANNEEIMNLPTMAKRVNQCRNSNQHSYNFQLPLNQLSMNELRKNSQGMNSVNAISIKQVSFPQRTVECFSDANSSTISPKRISCQIGTKNLFSLRNSYEKFKVSDAIKTQDERKDKGGGMKERKGLNQQPGMENCNCQLQKKKLKQANENVVPKNIKRNKRNSHLMNGSFAFNNPITNQNLKGDGRSYLGSHKKVPQLTVYSNEKCKTKKCNLEEGTVDGKENKVTELKHSRQKSRNFEKGYIKREVDAKHVQLSYPAKIVICLNDIVEEFQDGKQLDSGGSLTMSKNGLRQSVDQLSKCSDKEERKDSCSANRSKKRFNSGKKHEKSFSQEISFPLSGILTPQSTSSAIKISTICREKQRNNLCQSIKFSIQNSKHQSSVQPDKHVVSSKAVNNQRQSLEKLLKEEELRNNRKKAYLFQNVSSSMAKEKVNPQIPDLQKKPIDSSLFTINNHKPCAESYDVQTGKQIMETQSRESSKTKIKENFFLPDAINPVSPTQLCQIKEKSRAKHMQNSKENRKGNKSKIESQKNGKRWIQKAAERIKQQVLQSQQCRQVHLDQDRSEPEQLDEDFSSDCQLRQCTGETGFEERTILSEAKGFKNKIVLPNSLIPKNVGSILNKGKGIGEQDQTIPSITLNIESVLNKKTSQESTKFFYDEMEVNSQLQNNINESSYYIEVNALQDQSNFCETSN